MVDGVRKSEDIIVILRPNDVLVKEADLAAAQVPLPGAIFVEVRSTRYVSLASLAPHVRFVVNETALELDLQVETALLARSVVPLEPESTASPAAADPSGFLTYSITSDTADLSQQIGAFLQGGAGSAGAGLFTGSASYENGTVRRGLLNYRRESEANLSQVSAGDEFASTGNLGANIVVGGLGATRQFEFQPEYAYFPTPGLTGTALSPTTADLYVNGTFLRSIQLPPGVFNLSNIPVEQGAGVTQVVLHDAYGNTQSIAGVYYEARQLLRKGLTDYNYHLGFLRPNPFGTNDVYGPLAALAEYRLGLTDEVTVGGRFERTAGIVSAGPQVDFALPAGHVSLEAAESSAFGVAGNAVGAAYDYYSRAFGIGLSAQTQSAAYATASLRADQLRQRSNVRETIGFPISRFASIDVSNSTSTYTSSPASTQVLAEAILRAPRRPMYLTISAQRDSGGSIFGFGRQITGPHWTLGALLTFSRRSSYATLGESDNAGHGTSTTLAISKDQPTGPGFGYQVEGTDGPDRSAAARIAYQTQYGDIDALSSSGIGPSSTQITATGALVGFRQGLFFTRPVSGAYSLVDVPGYAHLPAFFESQYAGRTDGRDAMIVPNLSPYSENRIGIDELPDRLDLTEDSSVNIVRPKDLSGVVTKFTIRHYHAYFGHIVIHSAGRSIVPNLGQLILRRAGNDFESDLGREGQFYLENFSPGVYAATVTTMEGITCTFEFDLPEDGGPVTPLGTHVCDAAR